MGTNLPKEICEEPDDRNFKCCYCSANLNGPSKRIMSSFKAPLNFCDVECRREYLHSMLIRGAQPGIMGERCSLIKI